MVRGLPPAFEALFTAAGPVLRYRIMRDLARRDDTYIETLPLRQQVEKLPVVQDILAHQRSDGSWGNLVASDAGGLDTEQAVLTLCELGLGNHEAVDRCAAQSLLPRLTGEADPATEPDMRRSLYDRLLRLLMRAGFGSRREVRESMTELIAGWSDFLHRAEDESLFVERNGGLVVDRDVRLPTIEAYDAVCSYQWPDEDEEEVRAAVTGLFAWAEERGWPDGFLEKSAHRGGLFRVLSKEEYLAHPERMLYELELSARLGFTREIAATRWMLDELEIRQDADGFFRFDAAERSSLPWYFPLEEARAPLGLTVEWTFRGLLIFALLEYDV
jgi:hypothetical protein